MDTHIKKQQIYKAIDESARTIFVERIKNESKENLVYVDESGIDTYLYREYALASRGKKIIERVSGRKFARQLVVVVRC